MGYNMQLLLTTCKVQIIEFFCTSHNYGPRQSLGPHTLYLENRTNKSLVFCLTRPNKLDQ